MPPHVLVIDDDPDSLSMVFRTLRLHLPDVFVATAVNAANALQLMQKTKYEVIISDMIMPGMDGIEFLREVRRLSSHTVVILLTAGQLPPKADVLAEGAHAVVAKPFEVSAFIGVVADALHRANVLRQVKGFED